MKLFYLRATAGHTIARRRRQWARAAVGLIPLTVAGWWFAWPREQVSVTKPRARQAQAAAAQPGRIWLVETRSETELYSNGLRIEATGSVPNRVRSFLTFADDGSSARATRPLGIVYHTTESHLAPFRVEENARLLEARDALVDYLRRHHSYHYLVDRFGRVFRIVNEEDAADHAGNSIWVAAGRICVNLNHAFLSVAFEGRTAERLSPAQLHSGRILTEMLRGRHGIDAADCVTHAQVSVNPYNMRIGWHTDLARGLPFAQLGLPPNYGQPLASITHAGFEHDSAYLAAAGEELWTALHRSDELVRTAATKQGLTPAAYRKALRRRYLEFTRKES